VPDIPVRRGKQRRVRGTKGSHRSTSAADVPTGRRTRSGHISVSSNAGTARRSGSDRQAQRSWRISARAGRAGNRR
jgi:hypothetical protein